MNWFWSTLSAYAAMARDYVYSFMEWTEHHPGLGGWVGAIGAILAVFVAWGLARTEYLRTRRAEASRINSEIALFVRITSEFQPIVARYIETIDANDTGAVGYLGKHQDDVVFLRTIDLNLMPVTQWPSVESYDAFKRYFLASYRLMETVPGNAYMEQRKQAYVGTFEALQKALTAARR